MLRDATISKETKADTPYIADMYHDDRFEFAGIPHTQRPHCNWVLFSCRRCNTRYFERMLKVAPGLGNALHKLERYPIDPYSTASDPEAMLAISRCRRRECEPQK